MFAPIRHWIKRRLRNKRNHQSPGDPPLKNDQPSQEEPYNEEVRQILTDGLFDPTFYLKRNPDVLQAGQNPLVHFCTHGWREGRDPSLFFSVSHYLNENPDVAAADVNPLLHYIRHGEKERRSPAIYVSLVHLEALVPSDGSKSILSSFQALRRSQKLSPHPLIDLAWIESNHPDNLNDSDSLAWFLQEGWKVGFGLQPQSEGFGDRKDFLNQFSNFEDFFGFMQPILGTPGLPSALGRTILPELHCVITSNDSLPERHRLESLQVFVHLSNDESSRRELFALLTRIDLQLDIIVFSDVPTLSLPDWIHRARLVSSEPTQVMEELLNARHALVWLFLDNHFERSSFATRKDWQSQLHNLIGSSRAILEAVSFLTRHSNRVRLVPIDKIRSNRPWILTAEPWNHVSAYFKVTPELIGRVISSADKREEVFLPSEDQTSHSRSAGVKEFLRPLLLPPEAALCPGVNFVRSTISFENSQTFDISRPYFAKKNLASYQAALFSSVRPKICVYTAIVGAYESLKSPEVLEPDIDYICFTDGPLFSHPIWKLRPIHWFDGDPAMQARHVKLNPHRLLPEYDLAIWCDASVLLKKPLRELTETLDPSLPLHVFKHPLRDCIYAEAEACKRQGKGNPLILDEQIARYRTLGVPEKIGLIESGFFIANLSHPDCHHFFDAWWNEIKIGSPRDQIAYGLAKFSTGFEPKYLFGGEYCLRNHSHFALFAHGNGTEGYFEDPAILSQMGRRTLTEPSDSLPESDLVSDTTRFTPGVDIIICVHNSGDVVKDCIDSVLRSASANARIIVVDDASTEPALLANLAERQKMDPDRFIILRNSENLGYTKSANQGFRHSEAELVVLLNSDTIVPKGFLDKVRMVMGSHPNIGIAGPMSNAAGYQSLPRIQRTEKQTPVNALPPGHDLESVNQLCSRLSRSLIHHPLVPLVHGFCLIVNRKVFEKIGYFDEEHFPFGYGEENDFCIRAYKAGFDLVLANDLFVFHHKSKSFSDFERRQTLMREGAAALAAKHGKETIQRMVETMTSHPCLRTMRELFAAECSDKIDNSE